MNPRTTLSFTFGILALGSLLPAQTCWAAGYTAGTATFGDSTAVLDNGNVLIGDPGFSSSSGVVGRVGVYTPGSANPLKTFDGSVSGSRRGEWVGQIGDVNADGANDFVMSEPGTNKVYVHSGKSPYAALYAAPLVPPAVAGVTFTNFGHRAISLGDLNNDTYDDIAISCTRSSQGPGHVFVYTSQSAFSMTFAYRLTLANGSGASHQLNQYGHDLAYDAATKKLLVGAPYYTASSAGVAQGCVAEYTLNVTGVPLPGATVRQLPTPGNLDKFGFGVTFVEDTDNDNKPEWASGAEFRWNPSTSQVGQVAVFRTATSSFTTYGAANINQSRIGAHIRAVDDMDGDGFRDLVTSDIGGTLHAVSGGLTNGAHLYIVAAAGYRLAPISVGANLFNIGGWGGTSLMAAKTPVPNQPAQACLVHLAGQMNRGGGCAASGSAPTMSATRPLENTLMTLTVASSNALHQNQVGILQISTTNPLPYQAMPWPFCGGSYFTNGGLQVGFTTDNNGNYPQQFTVPVALLGTSLPVQAVVNNATTSTPDLTNVIFLTIGNQ